MYGLDADENAEFTFVDVAPVHLEQVVRDVRGALPDVLTARATGPEREALAALADLEDLLVGLRKGRLTRASYERCARVACIRLGLALEMGIAEREFRGLGA